MLLAHEDGPRLRIAHVGCGNHAYRSIFPSFAYLAVDLVAVCDLDTARAEKYARQFGARHVLGSLDEALARDDIDAVTLCVGPKQHPDLAAQVLARGLPVWLEKPPSMDVSGIDTMIAAAKAGKTHAAVGFKKVFMPALRRMVHLLADGRLGKIRTIQGRFPMDVPVEGPAVLEQGTYTNWLGNGVHPLSALLALAGRPDTFQVFRAATGGGFAVMKFPGGAVGNLHLAAGHASSGIMERYEVVCEHGHLVLDNNCRLSVHRPGFKFDYGQGYDFTDPGQAGEDAAALVYEPQHTLSTLHNKALFLQGFVPELDHFVEACLHQRAPELGDLAFARAVMECYEAGLNSQGREVLLDELPCNR